MAENAEPTESNPAVPAEQKIRRCNQEWIEALIKGDTETLNQLMDEGCVFSYILDGDDREQFITDIQSGDLKVVALKRDNIEVRVFGSTGVLIAHDEADWVYKGSHIQAHYRTIHVYAERDSRWHIVAIQVSPISLQ
jgi:ketosteroid isomerase-like protein